LASAAPAFAAGLPATAFFLSSALSALGEEVFAALMGALFLAAVMRFLGSEVAAMLGSGAGGFDPLQDSKMQRQAKYPAP